MDETLFAEGARCPRCARASFAAIVGLARDWWLPTAAGATLAIWTALCRWLLA